MRRLPSYPGALSYIRSNVSQGSTGQASPRLLGCKLQECTKARSLLNRGRNRWLGFKPCCPFRYALTERKPTWRTRTKTRTRTATDAALLRWTTKSSVRLRARREEAVLSKPRPRLRSRSQGRSGKRRRRPSLTPNQTAMLLRASASSRTST